MPPGLRPPPHDSYQGLPVADGQRSPSLLQTQSVRAGDTVVHALQPLTGDVHAVHRPHRSGPHAAPPASEEPVGGGPVSGGLRGV